MSPENLAMKPICFYHKADLDGVCSGAIVKHFVPDVELYGFDYGEEFPWALVEGCLGERQPDGPAAEDHGPSMRWKAKRTVYMVDVSLPPEDMKRLAQISNLVWLDHHLHALGDCGFSALGIMIDGLRDVRWAVCELAWKHFSSQAELSAAAATNDTEKWVHAKYNALHSDVPEVVRLLGRYDVADRGNPDWSTKILPFQYGCRTLPDIYNPEAMVWKDLFGVSAIPVDISCSIEAVRRVGSAILRYQAEQNHRACETGAHEVYIPNVRPQTREELRLPHNPVVLPDKFYRAIACNTIVFNSQFFDGFYDPEKHDVMCAYAQLADGRWKVSLYSTKPEIDCGAIAKTFGGGGHAGAAGFVCDRLPWETL